MKTKEEFYKHVDKKKEEIIRMNSYFLEKEEFSARTHFIYDFIKEINSHIFDKVNTKKIIDKNEYDSDFDLYHKITDYQDAEFWFNPYGAIRKGLAFEIGLCLKSPKEISEKDRTFLKSNLSKKIPKRNKFFKEPFNFNRLYTGESLWEIKHRSYWENYSDIPEIKNLLDNDKKGFVQLFKNYFDQTFEIFKPLADTLEKNYQKYPEIVKEKAEADLIHKNKLRELSDRLFE